MSSPGRVAVIAGCRTPFAKAFTEFRDLTALDLATACTRELIERSEVDPRQVGIVVMGQVIASPFAPNLGREVTLRAGLPAATPAHTVNRACASAVQAIAEVTTAIQAGHAEAGIAGGAESLSDAPILHSKRMSAALVDASRAKGWGARLRAFASLRPRDLVPRTPAIAEPSTGLSMGESAEKMAKENGITRAEQDEIAVRSHRMAAAAIADGRLPRETCAVFVPPRYRAVTVDNLVRHDATREALGKLPPVFDKRNGSVTAGNASPLTDGAAAVLLMSESRAAASGQVPLAFVRAWAVAAVDPGGQLLMGPGLAIPLALERAGITLGDVDLIEMHEAFAAQVASNIQALESAAWAKQQLGRDAPVGTVDRQRLNVCGSSIALGHPFGATGARIVTTLANEMARRGAKLGLVSVCAQGGMGFAMVLERVSALAGIRVIDLTRYIPGPYATLLLSDLGADVVKIEEPPLGDPVRAVQPSVGGESAVHAALNRNKRSMLVDIRQEAGARLVLELAKTADVFVESFRPGSLQKRGLGADTLLAQNPRLVYCSLSGYGQTGAMAPVAGHDVNYEARAALLPMAHERPALGIAQLADMAGGLYAALGIVAALQAREKTGRGQVVDASVWRSAMGLMTIPAARAQAEGAAVNELTGIYACYNVYRCRDGRYVSVGALEPKFWDALCRALGHQDRIAHQWEKEPARGETVAAFARSFATRDRDDWVQALRAADCCVEPVLDPYEAVAAARDSGALVTQPCGDAAFEAVGLPFGLSATPAVPPRPAPSPGQHTDALLAELGRSASAIQAMRAFGIVA